MGKQRPQTFSMEVFLCGRKQLSFKLYNEPNANRAFSKLLSSEDPCEFKCEIGAQ